jgi:hypothetical protein
MEAKWKRIVHDLIVAQKVINRLLEEGPEEAKEIITEEYMKEWERRNHE